MSSVIDGDNLLGTWPGRSRDDAEKRKLAREIDAFSQDGKRRVVLVFDGAPLPGAPCGSDVLFAGPGQKADAVIVDLLRHDGDESGWTVVTNDRSLADRCRAFGARIESARTFRLRLLA